MANDHAVQDAVLWFLIGVTAVLMGITLLAVYAFTTYGMNA